ncbi:MAG TPA: hypothetical protein VGA51_00100 [Casimicrobiaceae bacterium]
MKTRKTILTLALAAAASAVSFAASAVIANPDNDSGTYFTYNAGIGSAAVKAATLPRAGDVSANGLYVYSGSDRGWEARAHAFEIVAGGFVHTADCLPYNAPKPVAALVPIDQRGAFGDHGA